MAVEAMQAQGVNERWYSECDGRIQAVLVDDTVVLRAFSWEGAHEVSSVEEAADLLDMKYKEYRSRLSYE